MSKSRVQATFSFETRSHPINIQLPEQPVVREGHSSRKGFYGVCPCGTSMRVVPTLQWASQGLLEHVLWKHAPRTWLFTDKVARMVQD